MIPKKSELKEIIEQLGVMWRSTKLTEFQIIKKNAILKRIHYCQRGIQNIII